MTTPYMVMGDGISIFQGIWSSIASAINLIIEGGSKLYGGGAVRGIAWATISLIFGIAGYIKMVEIIGMSEGGWADRIKQMWHMARKYTIVWALATAAPTLVVGFQAISIGQVQRGAKAIPDAIGEVLKGYDALLSTGSSVFQAAPYSAMNSLPSLDNGILNDKRALAAAAQSTEAFMSLSKIYDQHLERLADLQKVALKGGGTAALSKLDASLSSLEGTVKDASGEFTKGVKKHAEAAGVALKTGTVTVGGQRAVSYSAPVVDDPVSVWSWLGHAATFQLGDVVKAAACYALGYGLCLVVLIGIAAGGGALLKEGIGALAYLAGVVLAMTVGTMVAMPFAPAFMLCFLSERLESYGRNFVSFLFSMAFASFGIAAAAKLVAGLIKLVGGIGIAVITQYLKVFVLGGPWFAGYALGVAGVALAVGMACSFVMELLKRGGAIGAGVWGGSFQV